MMGENRRKIHGGSRFRHPVRTRRGGARQRRSRAGQAEHVYAHGVVSETLPGHDRRLPPQWALQVPADYVEVLRTAVPAAVEKAGVDPARRDRHRHRLHRLHHGPGARRRHAAVRAAEFADRPHAYGKLWRHHSPQPQADRINALAAQRGEPWLPRYGGLISSEWEFAKALEILEDDPRGLSARWTTSWRPPTGSSGSCAGPTSATPAPPATRASGRTAVPVAGVPRRAATRIRRLRHRQAGPADRPAR